MVTLVKHDLEFILKQIKIAEQHAAGTPLSELVDSPLLPYGLRTVDGSYNNFGIGREKWGASGEPFKHIVEPQFIEGSGSLPPGYPTNNDYGQSGNVVDAEPRLISNLIADQTLDNPAAIYAALVHAGVPGSMIMSAIKEVSDLHMELKSLQEGTAEYETEKQNLDGALANYGIKMDGPTVLLPNVAPDEGISASYNSFLTLFGQFFDHGLDLVAKGGNGTVFIPLSPDDPLYNPASPHTNFMVMTRASVGEDARNVTTPWVDQNQTYTSHPSHQIFLREYAMVDGKPVATGKLLEGERGLATWADVKEQARTKLGIELTDKDVGNVPVVAVDPYGNFIPGPKGLPQLVVGFDNEGNPILLEGDLENPVNPTEVMAARTGIAFLDDIAHAAVPTDAPRVELADNFQGVSLASDASGVQPDPVLGNWKAGDPPGWEITGFGGLFDPTPNAIGETGHGGRNVVFLSGDASLTRDTGISLVTGTTYSLTLNVGDRFDLGFGGGTVQLVTSDGTVLASSNLPVPENGNWASVTLSTGEIEEELSGKELRIVIEHFGGGGEQALIDDVKLTSDLPAYDSELLDRHYITGDGRGNENIGLTAVHHVFHAEHNRVADHAKEVVLQSGDLEFLNEWLLKPVDNFPTSQAEIDALVWNGERIFQAARFVTEMEYQHLVFEEFARKIQPDVDIFMVQPDAELEPTIYAEFAHVVYRFGHSMLNETVDRINPDGSRDDMDLFHAFLNPLAFGGDGIDHHQAAGAIIRGMTGQVGNEIDEFVTNVLRNQLLGIPLDLAATNIARGRDTGTPTLNEARRQFMEMAGGDTQLKPYESWADFALNLKNPLSIVNFIAAYGTHETITSATTIQGKREAAWNLVMGAPDETPDQKAERIAWLNAPAAETGVEKIDLWIGGLAEKKLSFGGMLGSTFAFIFEMQMENLQDADRFYYLSRTQGLHLLSELEANSLAKMVLRNTDLGETGFALPGDIFAAPDHSLYVDYNKQLLLTGKGDPEHDDPVLAAFSKLVERDDLNEDGVIDYLRYNGADHVVIQGTDNNDTIIAGEGDDTVWGGAGDDRIEAGYGIDIIHGGDGDDIITNSGTDIGEVDKLHGDEGNDVIHGGSGMALLFGGAGKDFLMTGPDGSEVQGGTGDDFIMGGDGLDSLFGNEGDDWIEGHGRFEYIAGDNGDIFFNSTVIGHDVINGGQGDTDYDADSGDDIMVAGEGIQKFIGMWGHDWVIYKGQQGGADADMNFPMFPNLPMEVLRDRFSQVEALSGWQFDDVLRGDDRVFDDSFEPETEIEDEEEETEDLDGDDADNGGGGADAPGFTVVEAKWEEGPNVYDPTPEGNFIHNELDKEGIARITGLDRIITDDMLRWAEYWADGPERPAPGQDGPKAPIKEVFVGGNILLGGGGSDLFEGRGGDDVIDGDAWLNVRISIRDENGQEIATAEGMDAPVYSTSGDLLHNGQPLSSLVLERVYNPGQLHIVREILYDSSGIDTASYWDVKNNYVFDGTSDGRLVVEHVTPTETNAEDGNEPKPFDPITGKNRVSDGRDILANIEKLQFGDGTIDVTNGTNAANTLNGTSNNDIILGMDGDDTLNGNQGTDVLIGGRGNDTLNGDAGDDRLIGGVGNDTLRGGTGNDTYVFGLSDGNDTITEASGGGAADRIVLKTNGGALESLRAHDTNGQNNNGHLVIEYNGNQITVDGHYAGTNSQTGVEFINFDGGSIGGYDLGRGDYTISKSDSGSTRNGTSANDFIAGENGVDDTMNGDAGNDILSGGTGNDMITGGEGDDLMIGGAGDDRYAGEAGDDTILWRVGDGVDRIDGGTDYDTVHIIGDDSAEHYHILTRSEAVSRGISVFGDTEIVITRNGLTSNHVIARLDNIEEIVTNGMGGGDQFTTYGNFDETSLSHSTITLEGSEADDTVDISQLSSAHRIYFRSKGGNDTIIGTLRQQDVIELPQGARASDYRLVQNGDGTMCFTNGQHSITFTASDGVPQLSDGEEEEAPPSSENLNDNPPLPSNQEEDAESGEGSDVDDDPPSLEGDSGEGSDDQSDTAADDEDDDLVLPPPSTSTPANPLVGASGRDVLTGSAGADTLFGLEGDDSLMGGAGADVLDGGAGNDFLSGDDGRDLIFGGDGDDNILGGSGNDMLYADGGSDRIFGGDGDDLIDAGAGNDIVFGGAGNDKIVASVGDGDDTYYGDDMDDGFGIDTLDMSTITGNITADLGTGYLGRGTVVSAQSGTDTIWGIENIVTGSGDDVITASSAANVMDGGAGNDTFRFLSAADADGDTIIGFQPGDRIDLSAIDANSGAGGNQAFTLVNGSEFTGAAQLIITHESREDSDYTVVSGSTSGEVAADFRISIKGTHDLQASDFIL